MAEERKNEVSEEMQKDEFFATLDFIANMVEQCKTTEEAANMIRDIIKKHTGK